MFDEHDLEHQRLKVQVLLLDQLVLKLFVALAKDRAGDEAHERVAASAHDLVAECTAAFRENPHFGELHPAEQAMMGDVTADVIEDLETHLKFVLAGTM